MTSAMQTLVPYLASHRTWPVSTDIDVRLQNVALHLLRQY